MMRPVEFAPDVIVTAGEALAAAGKRITGFALRKKVGGGDPTRLKQVWDQYLAAGSNNTASEPVAELPVEVAEVVTDITKSLAEQITTMAVQLNDKAVRTAERRVAEVVRTASEQREQAERELTDAAQTVDELESELEELQQKADNLAIRLEESQATIQKQAVEIAKLHERLASSELAAKSMAEQHASTLKQAEDEIHAARSELEISRKDAMEQMEQLRNEVSEIKIKSAAESQAFSDLRAKAEEDATRQALLLEQATLAKENARKEAIEARESLAKMTGQLEAFKSHNADLLESIKKQNSKEKNNSKPPK